MTHLTGRGPSPLFLCLVFTAAVLVACDVVESPIELAGSGEALIDPNPNDISAPWRLTGPGGYSFAGSGDQQLDSLAPGSYTVVWRGVDGYGTPKARTQTLTNGGSVTFADNYVARPLPTGTIAIDSDPDSIDPAWVLLGEDGEQYWGHGDSTLVSLQIGSYTMGWGPVENWSSPTPNPESLLLEQGDTVTFSGVYTPLDPSTTGTVSVTTLPADLQAPWSLSGSDGFWVEGEGTQTIEGRAAGEYTLEWGSFSGYVSPPSETQILVGGSTLAFEGTFRPALATVSIDVEPDSLQAGWSLQSDTGDTYTGTGDTVLSEISARAYLLTWDEVSGWTAPQPNPQEVVLSDGDNVSLDGVYSVIPVQGGDIVIRVTPDIAEWTLTGPDFLLDGRGDYIHGDAGPGEYMISWKGLDGFVAPDPSEQSLVLQSGKTIIFSAVYRDPNGPIISDVTGDKSAGGVVRILGSGFGTHTGDVEWTGDWIEAQPDGTNPDTKPGWKHFLILQGPRDHITSADSWSGQKSIDISVDQTASPGSTESTLGYDHGDYNRIYASYWTYIEPLAHNTHPASRNKTGFKGIYLSLTDHGHGAASPISAPTNSAQTLQSFGESDNRVTGYTWSLWSWIACVPSASYRVWDEAVGVGYTLHPNEFYTAWINRAGSSADSESYAPSSGRWSRVEIYADAGIADLPTGEIMHALVDPVSGDGRQIGSWARNVVMRTDRNDCRSNPNAWENFIFQYFFDDTTIESQASVERAKFLLDDVYLQFGTRARVELGNDPVFERCTLLEIQPPASWSQGTIDVNLNLGGSFQPGDTAYLFVIQGDEQISAGYPVQLQ